MRQLYLGASAGIEGVTLVAGVQACGFNWLVVNLPGSCEHSILLPQVYHGVLVLQYRSRARLLEGEVLVSIINCTADPWVCKV